MKNDHGLIIGADEKARCWWHGDDPLYRDYHDFEWGRPVDDDIRLFEKMSLEGFQAGLSWLTILRKRENFRAAFAEFDFKKIACFSDNDGERLVQDAGIIRHRGKIEATVNNAQKTADLIDEYGSLTAYFWHFEPSDAATPRRVMSDIPSATDQSKALSKDLKKRGFKFVGPTTMYALMQAMGMVNDHLEGCCMHDEIRQLRRNFKRPSSLGV